jgi:hypothetical protein
MSGAGRLMLCDRKKLYIRLFPVHLRVRTAVQMNKHLRSSLLYFTILYLHTARERPWPKAQEYLGGKAAPGLLLPYLYFSRTFPLHTPSGSNLLCIAEPLHAAHAARRMAHTVGVTRRVGVWLRLPAGRLVEVYMRGPKPAASAVPTLLLLHHQTTKRTLVKVGRGNGSLF